MSRILLILLTLSAFAMAEITMIRDTSTGLMWEDTPHVRETKITQPHAKEYCSELRLGGFEDWRLPTIHELLTIVDYRREFKQKTVNAKAVNTLLSLGLEQEDSFKLQARGKDAKEAVQRLEAFFAELMQGDREMETLDKEDSLYEGPVIEGEIISRGIAIAAVHRYKERENRTENGVGFSEALAKSLEELDALYRTHAQNEDAGIYLAQRELLQAIAEQAGSLEIFEETISEESARLVGSKMEAKITDYKDILQRVKKQMGFSVEMLLPETPVILLAKDLLPSQIEQLQQMQVEGVVLKETTLTSHTAILLRAAGIPSLITDYSEAEEGHKAILDAHSGVIVTNILHRQPERKERKG